LAYWRNRRCLVTGGSGFIGSRLVSRLKEAGALVFAPAHLHDGGRSGMRCDVSSADQVQDLFATTRPDCVFHLAGVVRGDRDIQLVQSSLMANLVGTVNILCAGASANTPRVITLGSLMEPDESLPSVPCSPYAAAKFGASAYARMFASLFGLQVTIARPFMVYGPGQMDRLKLVPYVIDRLVNGNDANLSMGHQPFDWVYVDDVVDALLAIAQRTDLAGVTVEVGTGALTTVADVAVGIAERLGRPTAIRFGAVPDRQLEPTRAADAEEIERRIGWRARVTLDEGLDHTVAWFLARHDSRTVA